MYQLGFDLQAVPSTPWLKMSAAGAKCVAQTTFFSCSDRVSGEALDAFRKHPGSAVGDFDVRENIGSGELVLLTLRRFVGIRGECGDVDQPDDEVISSRSRDHATAVRVPTRIAGLLTRPSVRFTVATSLASESKPYWAAITWCPSA